MQRGQRLEAGTFDVYMSNSEDLGGFQIEFTGVNITGASGGAAESSGFTISNSSNMILGFSLTGSAIPAGEGVLTTVSFDSPERRALLDKSLADVIALIKENNLKNHYKDALFQARRHFFAKQLQSFTPRDIFLQNFAPRGIFSQKVSNNCTPGYLLKKSQKLANFGSIGAL